MFCRLLPRVTAVAARRRKKGVGDNIVPLLAGRCGRTVSSSPSDQEMAEELKDKEPWLQQQIKAYYRGKDKVAEMMGKDPATFTEKDLDDAIRYLLPSRLNDRDARPIMKHPLKIFPKRQVSAFDVSGRPIKPGFYTGSPEYHNILYEIYLCGKKLEKAESDEYWGYQTKNKASLKSTADQKIAEDRRLTLENLAGDDFSDIGENTLTECVDDVIEEVKMAEMDEEEEERLKLESPVGDVFSDIEENTMDSQADVLPGMTESADGSIEEVKMEDDTDMDEEEEGKKPKEPAAVMKWIKKSVMANLLAEELSDKQYDYLIKHLSQLADHKHSGLIADFLDRYRRPVFAYRSVAKQLTANDKGYVYAIGKRKTSVAKIWIKKGTGSITVNGMSLQKYFTETEQRNQVLYPLLLLDCQEQYDIVVRVSGGGITGQGGAIRLGISKALLAFIGSTEFGDILEKEGLLVRDQRMVERKKPGQKKARKKFTWVKR